MPKKITRRALIAISVIAVLIGLWWGVPTYRKASADALVRELCAKDGGPRVYETVRLPAERFDKYGNLKFGARMGPPVKERAQADDDFYYTLERTWIIPEASITAPTVWQTHQKMFRASDRKLLGEAISYSRRGGDPIGPWHPSSFGCPANTSNELERRIFTKQ